MYQGTSIETMPGVVMLHSGQRISPMVSLGWGGWRSTVSGSSIFLGFEVGLWVGDVGLLGVRNFGV